MASIISDYNSNQWDSVKMNGLKRVAFIASAALVALMIFNNRPVVMDVLPGQTCRLPSGAELQISAFDIVRSDDGMDGQVVLKGDIEGHGISASVNNPVVVAGDLIVVGGFGRLLVSHGGWRLYALAFTVIALMGAVWIRAGWKWMSVFAALLAIGYAESMYNMQFAAVWSNLWGFSLVCAIIVPLLSVFGKSFTWWDALLEFCFILALFALPHGGWRLPVALRSPFFIPHIGCYAIGIVMLLKSVFNPRTTLHVAGFAFMTSGLLLGSLWAQICWGSWWSWDPKECLSLLTWLSYGATFLAFGRLRRLALLATAALAVMTSTWVNFSSLFRGMHSYL